MNLSPDWVPVLQRHDGPAIHWSTVGDPWATDRTLIDWAVANGYIVLTHDLDFGTMLALTHATGPSVLQVRAEDVLPDHLEGVVITALRQHATELASGALVVVDESRVSGLDLANMRSGAMAAEAGTAADGEPAAVRSLVVPSEVGSRSIPPLSCCVAMTSNVKRGLQLFTSA